MKEKFINGDWFLYEESRQFVLKLCKAYNISCYDFRDNCNVNMLGIMGYKYRHPGDMYNYICKNYNITKVPFPKDWKRKHKLDRLIRIFTTNLIDNEEFLEDIGISDYRQRMY